MSLNSPILEGSFIQGSALADMLANSHHGRVGFSTIFHNSYHPRKLSRIPVPSNFSQLSVSQSSHLLFFHQNSINQTWRPGLPSSSPVTPQAQTANNEDEEFRRHNAGSAVVLGVLNSRARIGGDEKEEEEKQELAIEMQEDEDEVSLVRRRTPRFPGAVPSSSVAGNNRSLIQAIEVRRSVAADLLKEAMRASKFSITYSTNLVSRMSKFVDRMLIEAAALKRKPDFSYMNFNARVKIYIENSGVIPLVKWLKHNSLTFPQIAKVICSCTGDLNRVKQVSEWLKSVYVKGSFLGIVLTRTENLLDRSTEELEEIVDFLGENGVKRDWIGFVLGRCPQILSLRMKDLEQRAEFYLEMGMSKNDFGTMIYDYPKSLGFFDLYDMNDKVNYLREFGLSTDDLGRLLAHKPQLMGCSIEERWKPLVKYLYYLGVGREGMKRMLLMKPMIFCVDLETTIVPKVRFLQDIGVRQEALGGVLIKFPPILTYNLHKKIRPVVIFLITKAGVRRENIGKVLALEPELVGCSIHDKLEVNVKYFLSLGIPLQSLGEMIEDFPMLLKYNLDVLRPKYRYLRRVMVRPLQDLIEFPRFFSYSLEGRIIPRHKILLDNRINFKLRYMLPGSDEMFDRRVQEAVEKRRKFEETGADVEVNG